MFNFIKEKLFGIKTVTTQKIQLYTYEESTRELTLKEGPKEFPAHLIVKNEIIALYIGEQMKQLLEARIFAQNREDMNIKMQRALKNPSEIYEILGVRKSSGVKKYTVQKIGTADSMEIHISDKYFSIHSQYDRTIGKFRAVSQFFEK